MKRTAIPLFALAAALSFAADAHAGADDAHKAAAKALFEGAVKQMASGDYAHACPSFEEVIKLEPDGEGARLQLAECYRLDGRLASSWAAYNLAESNAIRLNQPERAASARKAAADLKPRLATITVSVPNGTAALPDLSVKRDGNSVDPRDFGTASPVDAGAHTITAVASGMPAWTQTITVRDGETPNIIVDFNVTPTKAPAGGPSPSQAESPHKKTSPLVYVGFGTAVVGLAVGTVTGIMTLSKGSTCKKGCTQSDLNGAEATGWVSNIGFGVGVAGLGVGVLGIVLTNKANHPATTGVLELQPGGAVFRGQFE